MCGVDSGFCSVDLALCDIGFIAIHRGVALYETLGIGQLDLG